MTPHAFQTILNDTVDDIHRLLEIKGGEYSPGDNRLSNFQEAAKRLGMSPLQVALVYLDKHYAAICNYAKDQVTHTSRVRSEPITGRISDAINYLILIRALLEDQNAIALAVANEPDATTLDWDE